MEGMLEGNLEVLKATSKNEAKQLKTWITIHAKKIAKVVVKQLTTKKLYIEKAQIKE